MITTVITETESSCQLANEGSRGVDVSVDAVLSHLDDGQH